MCGARTLGVLRAMIGSCVLAALLGCGDDGRASNGPRPEAGPRADGQVPPSTDAQVPPGVDAQVPPGVDGGSRDGGGRSTEPIQFCQLACSAAADCGSASAAFDADNYACEAGACRYLGCNSDAECADSFADPDTVCRDLAGLATCQSGCVSAADCATASAAFDADNYACDAGVCRYLGCNDDAECASSFADARYGCREAEPPDTGLRLPTATRNCVLTCAMASDCSNASAAFDSDNYECDGGACRYVGCNDDGECASTFMDARYVCR